MDPTDNPTPVPPASPQVKRRRRRRWFALLACLGSLICAGLALETGLRVYVAFRGWTPNCYAAHLSMFQPDPLMGATLASNFRLRSGTFQISTNAQGLRGPEIHGESQATKVPRIAILGGSSVFGYLVSDGDEAARQLETKLLAEQQPVEVINAGVPGFNLFQTTARFQECIAPLKPDMVVLYLGYNDIPYLTSSHPDADHWQQRTVPPLWERVAGHSVAYGLVRYRLLGSSTQFNGVATAGDTVDPAGRAQLHANLERLADAVQQTGAQLVICQQVTAAHPTTPDSFRQTLNLDDRQWQRTAAIFQVVRDELQSLATQKKALLIDAPLEITPNAEHLGDMIHLTQAGETQLANLLAERLAPLLADTEK